MGKISFLHTWNELELKTQTGFKNYCTGTYGGYTVQNQVLTCLIEQNLVEDFVEIEDFVRFLFLITRTKYSRKNLSNAFSDLHQWLHTYLVHCYLEEQPLQFDLLRLKALARFGLQQDFERIDRRVEKKIEAETEQNRQYFEAKIQLASSRIATPWEERHEHTMTENIDLLDESLDGYYALAKIHLSGERINRAGILAKSALQKEEANLKVLARKIANKKGGLYPSVFDKLERLQELFTEKCKPELLQNEHDAIEHEADLLYTYLSDLLYSGKIVNKENQEELGQHLMNNSIRNARLGKAKEYYERLFILILFSLENRIYVWRGYFHDSTFLTIGSLGMVLRKYEWVEEFVDTWESDLLPSKRYVAAILRGNLYFEQKKYQQAYDLVEHTQSKSPLAQTLFKAISLKCQYEINYRPENIKANIDAFMKYVTQKWAGTNRDSHLFFAKLMKKLFTKNITEHKMRQLIQKKPTVGGSAWLIEKAKELEQKR